MPRQFVYFGPPILDGQPITAANQVDRRPESAEYVAGPFAAIHEQDLEPVAETIPGDPAHLLLVQGWGEAWDHVPIPEPTLVLASRVESRVESWSFTDVWPKGRGLRRAWYLVSEVQPDSVGVEDGDESP